MASNYDEDASDESVSDFCETDTDSQRDSESESDSESAAQQVCIYYNKGHCRNGQKCPDLHVCKYFLKGNCRYGDSCRLKHIGSSGLPFGQRRSRGRQTKGHRERSCSSSDSDTDSSKPYRWQLNLGNCWEDVANDYVLEAQFSRPNTKGIRIYNTPCGALSIDFTRMRILKKTNLRVRRKGSRNTNWLWYYRGNNGWNQYGKKDTQGNVSPVSSSQLESEFQKNRCGTVDFTISSTNYEIQFKDMVQKNTSTGHKRRIRRRPKYVSPQDGGVSPAVNKLKSMMLSSSKKNVQWQFSGKGGNWHNFKPQGSCSVSSADIEAEYQRNPQGTMQFTVNGDQCLLDFSRLSLLCSVLTLLVYTLSDADWDEYEDDFNDDFQQLGLSAPVCQQLFPVASDSETGLDTLYQEDDVPRQMSVLGKHYEWQLLYGQQWLPINNDHIIECNYCQPGAKGITIDTHMGSLYIDFDTMTLRGHLGLAVRRLSSVSHNQREDMGWYYRDNSYWCEYGVQGSSYSASSISSQDLEQQYNSNPTGSFQFKAAKYSYTVDFSSMMQTNLSTRKQRNVRRRPKFNTTVDVNNSLNSAEPSTFTVNPLPSATPSANPSTVVTWQFLDNEGTWTEYQKPQCSLDSMDIERQYQSNPQSQLAFTAGRYSYILYFNGMYQINNTFQTKRAVQRISTGENDSSSLCQVRWQFKDMDGCWKDFVKGTERGKCTISNQEIEMQYQQNKTGTIRYSTGKFNYQLDFSAMTQTNMNTGTRRPVRRV